MKRTKWFNRIFLPIEDTGVMPSIIERLDGTPVRLKYKLQKSNSDLASHEEGKWSIKKQVGHLIDLEPLWYKRMQQIMNGESDLEKADLTNRKTHETDYDSQNAENLIERFAEERQKLINLLKKIDDLDMDKAAIHPRLGTPMKLIDLAFFVAEHDDHHLAQMTLEIDGG